MPEFGMMFKFDADYDTIKWYEEGNGVLRVEQNGQMFLIDIYNHRLK